MSSTNDPVYARLTIASLFRALKKGWGLFLHTRSISVTYAMIFAVIGVLIFVGIVRASYALMIFPLAGGFMLVGPVLLLGFFAISDCVARGEDCNFSDIVRAYSRTSREMLVIAFVCALLFILWITNVATLYGFIVRRTPSTLLAIIPSAENVIPFLLMSSLIGIFLAFVIFSISAFSVPLLYYRRAGLFRAVALSVSAVFANFAPSLLWAAILTVTIIGSIIIFPLFLLTFPVLAFASHTLYRELFPE